MTAPGVVDYTGMKGSENLTGFQNLTAPDETLTGLQTLSGLEIQPTPSTHTIAILPEALKGFEQGIIIGAYDQAGNCFGATVYNSEFISLTVFGDDPTTAEKDGFVEGEMILFGTLTGFQTLSGLTPTFDPQLPSADGLFTENGISVITGFESSTGIFANSIFSHVNIYPNPSYGKVNISGLVNGARINITDVKGQLILTSEAENSELLILDLTDRNAGVYFLNIQYYGNQIFRKIVLR